MARDAGDLFDARHQLGRNTLPLGHRTAGYPKFVGDLGHEAALASKGSKFIHAAMLSTTEQRLQELRSVQISAVLRHPYRMELSNLIVLARKAKRISQRAVASKLGVSPSAVAQWELGLTRPTSENMAGMRRLLDIDGFVGLSPTSPYLGELVDDPDELALLEFWRGLNKIERVFLMRTLLSNLPNKPGIGPNISD